MPAVADFFVVGAVGFYPHLLLLYGTHWLYQRIEVTLVEEGD